MNRDNKVCREAIAQSLKRRLSQWGRVATGAALLIVMPTSTIAAQVPEICRQNNGANILKCQKTCAKACEDPEFQYAEVNGKAIYEAKCEKVLAIPEAQR